jgi:hypothetical protein
MQAGEGILSKPAPRVVLADARQPSAGKFDSTALISSRADWRRV